jgi:hypothetical protein
MCFTTDPNTGVGFAVNASGDNAYNVVTGTRFVIGPKGDLGLIELGVSNTIGVGVGRYVNDLLRYEFRFSY